MTSTIDLIESAVRQQRRLAFWRGGTEYVVVAIGLETSGRRDVLLARIPMTGEVLRFAVDELRDVDLIE